LTQAINPTNRGRAALVRVYSVGYVADVPLRSVLARSASEAEC
jgi:hypothetical protein